MVGSAKIRYQEISAAKVVVSMANHKAMQNHIGQIHVRWHCWQKQQPAL